MVPADPFPQAQLYDQTGVGVWILGPQYLTEYANAPMAELLGCTPAQMEGVSFFRFVPDETHAEARAYLQRSRQGSSAQAADLPFRRGDGALFWGIVSARPLTGGLPESSSLACVIVDITERRRAEAALRQSEAQYRVLAETAEDHIFVIDREDRVDYVNQAAARQLRTTPGRIIGRRRSEIFPPEVAERQGRSLQRVFATGRPFYVEGRTVYLDREVWLGTWLAPVPDANGAVKAVLGLSRDLTERKRAEDALRGSEQRLQVVLSNLPLVLWATDGEGVITFCGGRALEAVGGTSDAIVGRTVDDIDIEPFPHLREDLRRALAGESLSRQIEVGTLTLETWSVPLRDEHNLIAGATGVVADVTERRRLEAELLNAQKLEAVGRLAGGIAHDFNNHLTAILGYVEMMLGQSGDGAPLAADLREVQHAAKRAAGLVRRLLAFGRRQVLQRQNLNLNTIIDELTPMLERLIGETIQIDVSLAPELSFVTGDAGELEQIIMNLALNARDAMPGGGTLTIETAAATAPEHPGPGMGMGPYVVMTIRDTGAGMAPHVKQHVFEPFFTTKPSGQSTGLGLSTVYTIVQQLNGFIQVDSEVGLGTTFHVYLPAAVEATVPEVVSAAPALPDLAPRRGTILLVEDEDTVRRFAKLALERHGFSVIDTGTPEEALLHAAVIEQPLSLLLTDVVMPRISGPELAHRLKAMRPDLSVLFMSGYPSSLALQDGVLDPSVRLISKPFTTAELIMHVDNVLRTERSAEQ